MRVRVEVLNRNQVLVVLVVPAGAPVLRANDDLFGMHRGVPGRIEDLPRERTGFVVVLPLPTADFDDDDLPLRAPRQTNLPDVRIRHLHVEKRVAKPRSTTVSEL